MMSFKLVLLSVFLATVTSSRPRFSLTGRIVGGQDAERAKFPYFASLTRNENFEHFCGGSIISHWHILTAAHCVEEYKNRLHSIKIVLGVTRIGDNFKVAQVEKISVHPKFGVEFFINDIALLKTVNEIKFSERIQPIQLAQSNSAATGHQNAILCGLGMVMNDPAVIHPNVLQYQITQTFSRSECAKKYDNFFFESPEDWSHIMGILKEKVFCALIHFGKGACNGDSGGPLTFNNTVVGIVSALIGCARGYPDIYTDVYEHRQWIQSEMEQMLGASNNK